MDHKGSIIHLDFLSKSQDVVFVRWQLIPNNRIPIKINSITSTWFSFRNSGQDQLVQSYLLQNIP